MSLLDEFRQEQSSRKPVACRIAVALEQMDKDDADALVVALGDESIQHVTVTNVLRAHGYSMGKDAVAHHRRGQCGCAR